MFVLSLFKNVYTQQPASTHMQQEYFQHCPEGFAETADVLLVVGNEELPAHSQFLASQSRFFNNMLADLNHRDPSRHIAADHARLRTPPELLSRYSKPDVVAFLQQVYAFGQLDIRSCEQAYALFQFADIFDSPALMAKCCSYLEKTSNFLQATTGRSG